MLVISQNTHTHENFVHLPDVRSGKIMGSLGIETELDSILPEIETGIIENKLCTVYFQFYIARCSTLCRLSIIPRVPLVHTEIYPFPFEWMDFVNKRFHLYRNEFLTFPLSSQYRITDERAQIKSKTTILAW